MEREVMVARIYISEADQGRRRALVDEIFELLHDQHRVKGVTVFRGIAGFGAAGEAHSADLLRLTANLPLVIEFFDEPRVVAATVKVLNGLIPPGRLVCWRALCLCPD